MVKLIIGGIVLTFILVAAFTALGGGFGGGDIASSTSTTLDDETALSISISGEVNRPGTYLLEVDSTLKELIDAASGVTGNADKRCYFEDYELLSGQAFYIAPIYDNSDVCAISPIAKVNINNAEKSELMEIEQIGTTLASAIIAYREDEGEFRSLEEIKNVDGIGPATYEKVKDYITLKD